MCPGTKTGTHFKSKTHYVHKQFSVQFRPTSAYIVHLQWYSIVKVMLPYNMNDHYNL